MLSPLTIPLFSQPGWGPPEGFFFFFFFLGARSVYCACICFKSSFVFDGVSSSDDLSFSYPVYLSLVSPFVSLLLAFESLVPLSLSLTPSLFCSTPTPHTTFSPSLSCFCPVFSLGLTEFSSLSLHPLFSLSLPHCLTLSLPLPNNLFLFFPWPSTMLFSPLPDSPSHFLSSLQTCQPHTGTIPTARHYNLKLLTL